MTILERGRNCWRTELAARAAVLVDAQNYFNVLEQTLRRARKSILIAGWDFDGTIFPRSGRDHGRTRSARSTPAQAGGRAAGA
ncbi:hypothetical protein QW131_00735 [Roseibium salinum]|nr:hypothetical protein [Roseibium salinum]